MKNFKNVFVLLALVLLGVAFYINFSYKQSHETINRKGNSSKINMVLEKESSELKENPIAIVEFYSELLQCLYNEKPSDKEIQKLGLKAREILDEELKQNNPEENYLKGLSTDVLLYQKANRVILSYTIDSNNDTHFYTQEEKEYAVVKATYTIREVDTFTKTKEEYILRKDEQGNWNILGWRVDPQSDFDDPK